MPAPPVGPIGVMLTAMVTPFSSDGALDVQGAQRLAAHLVDTLGNDGLVVNGTTGEAPTTTDEEKARVVRAVKEAVGDRARVIAGVGTYDTAHSVHLAREAAAAGADGLLVVSPYYSRPPQEGLLHHFRTVADATELPVVTYDIPKRTGVAIEVETLVRLSEHPRIVANKDAKGDLDAAQWAMARCDLGWYSGDDILNLPLLAVGANGFVSVAGHLVADRIRRMAEAFHGGDVCEAIGMNRALLPVYSGIFRTQGVILTKAALVLQGLPAGPVRSPLIDATAAQVAQLRRDLEAGGVRIP
ncbi:MAG: 4-hydroxy-tetrahydrodipicolinate synthase [Candidatus Nanopelagicales bacterium]